LRYSVETEPLGTGGAIRHAVEKIRSPDVLVLNGDTFVELDHAAMMTAHQRARARLTVATHPVEDAGRYGTLEIRNGLIHSFREKGRAGAGMINAGIYALSKNALAGISLRGAFSFEYDFLMPHVAEMRPLAFPVQGVFIDIGVPEDYERAPGVLAPFGPCSEDSVWSP
jgi:D-glycero-alpha-D-manno-heptose 1-phosphate guanylyltransferase